MPGASDGLGFLAAALTLATFAQRSMLPMRVLAVAANLCFIGYGGLGGHSPVLLLHLALLPLNLLQLRALLAGKALAAGPSPPGARAPTLSGEER
jgi:hypothetical protein